jgi:hypothetical protein
MNRFMMMPGIFQHLCAHVPIKIAEKVKTTPEPADKELKILRSLDPYRIVLRD